MADDTLTTSLVVEFESDSGGSSSFISIESAEVGVETGLFDVYASSAYTIFTPTGSAVISQRGLTKEVTEFAVFQNSTTAGLDKPVVGGLTWAVEGAVWGSGSPAWDGTQFVSTKPIIALIKATYTTRYDRGTAFFPPAPPDVYVDGSRKAAERPPFPIAAIMGNDAAVLTMNPVALGSGAGGNAMSDMGAVSPKMIIDVDPSFPAQLALIPSSGKGNSASGGSISAHAGIRVWTNELPRVYALNGSIVDLSNGPANVVEIVEGVAFDGKGSANLKYFPWASVSIDSAIGFVDGDGNGFSPSFAYPGQTVAVESGGKLTNRVLGPTEVAVLDYGKVVNKAVGVATVRYAARFYSYILDFVGKPGGGPADFMDATVVAVAFKAPTASLVVPAPSAGGRK